MAIVHRATVTPSKIELVTAWLDRQAWGGAGEVEKIGGYRFDDPDGEVGVEALLVRRGPYVLHVPLTYRAAPLADAETHLVGTMEHSVLGRRWIYAAAGDPVALACFAEALAGSRDQAGEDLWDGDTFVEHRTPTVVVSVEGSVEGDAPATPRVRFVHVLDDTASHDDQRRLVADWPGGRAVVATSA